MARLNKHGKELLRVEAEIPNPESTLTSWERVTRTYHSDGQVLQKHDVRWKPDLAHPQGELYSYGWKLFAKLKRGVDPVVHAAKVADNIRSKPESRWKIIASGPPPLVISQDRIVRAVESGEMIGFCKECGHEQDGCEPDARNYPCDRCGAKAVYGAEECLIGL